MTVKIMLRESSGISPPPPPPPPPPPGSIQDIGFPVGFTFIEGVASSAVFTPYFSGPPTLVALNKPTISDELVLTGITWTQATATLAYDGTTGVGRIDNFQAEATDGMDPVTESMLPYKLTKPYQSTQLGPVARQDYEGGNVPAGGGPSADVTGLIGFPGGKMALAFANAGGDWWDGSAAPVKQGSVPFQTINVPNSSPAITVDVTKLVRLWQNGDIQNYGFFFHQHSNGASCEFRAYGSASGVNGPFLNLTYTDSTTEQILASVIAIVSGSSNTPVGSTVVRFSGDAICYFDISTKTKKISSATITVSPFNTFGPAGIFDLFAVRWEGQVADGAPTWGLAQNYPHDTNIMTHPDVIWSEQFPDLNLFEGIGSVGLGRGGWRSQGSSWGSNGTGKYAIVVGDVDPEDPTHYSPLVPGMTAVKWKIPAGENGGRRLKFSFWPMFGSGPLISSSFTDYKEIYVRWYQRWANNFNPLAPDWNGHLTGTTGSAVSSNDGFAGSPNAPLPFVAARSGRYVVNPLFKSPFIYEDSNWVTVTNFDGLQDVASPMSTAGYTPFYIYRYDHNAAIIGSGSGVEYMLNQNHRGSSIKINRWYCIEQYTKMNTPPYPSPATQTTSNGIQRLWVDGRLAMERTNCCMIFDDIPGIDGIDVQHYYGGTNNSPTQLDAYMTGFVVATSQIGPMVR